jgi:hypothetical protein
MRRSRFNNVPTAMLARAIHIEGNLATNYSQRGDDNAELWDDVADLYAIAQALLAERHERKAVAARLYEMARSRAVELRRERPWPLPPTAGRPRV